MSNKDGRGVLEDYPDSGKPRYVWLVWEDNDEHGCWALNGKIFPTFGAARTARTKLRNQAGIALEEEYTDYPGSVASPWRKMYTVHRYRLVSDPV